MKNLPQLDPQLAQINTATLKLTELHQFRPSEVLASVNFNSLGSGHSLLREMLLSTLDTKFMFSNDRVQLKIEVNKYF